MTLVQARLTLGQLSSKYPGVSLEIVPESRQVGQWTIVVLTNRGGFAASVTASTPEDLATVLDHVVEKAQSD